MTQQERLYRKRWKEHLDELCLTRVTRARLRIILRSIFHDGEDVRIRGSREESQLDFSFTPTPVEQILRFVSEAFSRLQEPLTDLLDEDESESEGEAQARRQRYLNEHPEHFQRFGNLRLLVRLSLCPKPPRALSDLERLRLFAQWSNLRYKCAQLTGKPEAQETARNISLLHLKRIEEEIAYLSTSDREVQALRAQCLYRRATIAAWNHPSIAAEHLRGLFAMESSEIPAGLYFHAARRLSRLPVEDRVRILSETRTLLARAFALIDQSRVLDRVGICLLLGLDAVGCLAPDTATRMAQGAQCLRRATPRVDRSARNRKQIDGFHRRVMREIAELRKTRQDLAQYRLATTNRIRIEERARETGAMLKGSGIAATMADLDRRIAECDKDGWFVESLYNTVSQSRIAQLIPNAILAVTKNGVFLESANRAIADYRDQALIGKLLVSGCISRVQAARASEQIDAAFDEFERLVAACVLYGDWTALANQLQAPQLHSFLDKVGFERDSKRIKRLGEHIAQAFGVTGLSAMLDEALFGYDLDQTSGEAINDIQNRWHLENTLDGLPYDCVGSWAESFRGTPEKFSRANDDYWVRRFFDDCDAARHAGNAAQELGDAGAITLLTNMAYCAYRFCFVLRRAQGKGALPMAAAGMTDREWLAAGATWADKACRLARNAGRSRTAALFRATDVRKRLERASRGTQDGRVLQRTTQQMLEIDEARLSTTVRPERRARAILRAERSLCETVWEAVKNNPPQSFSRAVPLRSNGLISRWFMSAQNLKSLNFAYLNSIGTATADDDEQASAQIDADNVLEFFMNSDSLVRSSPAFELGVDKERALSRHLRDRSAAIVDFLTHPGGNPLDLERARTNNWGTICFLVAPDFPRLMVKLYFLKHVTEPLILQAVDGRKEMASRAGLVELWRWNTQPPGDLPSNSYISGRANLDDLGKELFPDDLRADLDQFRRLYICPHRQLFQVPIHALPLDRPLFKTHEISYGLKTEHVAKLVSEPQVPPGEIRNRFALIDHASLGAEHYRQVRRLGKHNQWSKEGLGVEELLKEATRADQAVICCHGQMDPARAWKTRLRLWGGGRLTVDDIGRVAVAGSGSTDYIGSDWVIAACDAGRSKVAMRMTEGLSLRLVSVGARRVTSSLYRITPEIASRFLSYYLVASDDKHGSPFTAAVRGMAGRDWNGAASFVSYGLFQRPTPKNPRT
jgi:hypothetical protein